ncbi:hypothetical protein H310_00341 [Aphanomyces invadans]|uniref:Ion transport domain-containing protein n=1 Tax=Aphanomyces invadans TaxID=157072 RepID=A0A024UVH5_9STRA|nr:hypothetical protein H310_00341 [Aphanomyces invadans]ETW09902.1 hypothetical protein H310_00341 [Aphanomyces invadans]|eukprot:XP_008861313.1 hypothetical protein H310_00341 [Aphanomyces invadans]
MSDVQDKGGTVMPLPDSVEDDNANATRLPLPEMCESMAPIQESKSTSIPEDSAVIPAPFAPPPEIPPSPSRTSSRILSVSSRLNSDDRAKTFRSRMRVKLVDNPEGSRIGRFYHNGFLAIIVCNLIGLMLETLDGPNHGSSDPMYPMLPFSKSYVQSDMFFTGIFTLDLIVKCAIAKSQKQFWTSIVTIMDVLAVLPLYIIAVKAGTLRMSNTEIQLPSEQYIKLLRLFRIIRVVTMLKNTSGMRILYYTAKESLAPLTITLFFLITFIMVFATVLFYAQPCYNVGTCVFTDIFNAGYFTMVTVATVGYGDQIVDLNNITAVIVVCVMMIFGALYLAMPLAIVGIKYEMLWTQHESERKLKIRADSYRTTGKPPPSELNQIIHIDSMRLVPMSNAINVQFVEFCELASVLSRDCAKFVSLANPESLLNGPGDRNRDEATTKLIDTLLRAIKAHKALSRTVESLVPRELLKPNALAKQPNVSETSPSRHSTFKQTMISRAKRALSGAAHPDDTAQHDPNAKLPFRRRLFLLLERPHSSRQANYVNKFFLITVILSMLLFYAETTPELQAYGMSTELCHRALESYCKQSSITPSTDPGCFVYSSPTVSTSTKLNFHCHPDEVADALNVSPCISLGWNYGSNTSAIVCSKSFSDTEKICNLRQCRPNHVPMFDMSTKWLYFECYFGFVFTAEWFLRFYAARHRLAFVRSFGTCIDTFAITPFYAELITGVVSGVTPMYAIVPTFPTFISVVPMTKTLRIFKLAKHFKSTMVLVRTAELTFRRLMIPLFFLFLGCVSAGAIFYEIERGTQCIAKKPCKWWNLNIMTNEIAKPFPPGKRIQIQVDKLTIVTDMLRSTWMSIVTFTTVGYGDMRPRTPVGKIADILAMVLGSIYTAMPLSLIGGQFYACYEQYLKDRDSSRRNGGSVAYTSVGGVTAKKQRRRTVIGAEDVPTLSQFVALSRLLNAVILNACRLNTMAAQPAKIGNNGLPLPPLLDSVVHNTEKTVQSMRRFSSSRRNSNPDAVLIDAIAATRVYEKKVQTVNALINSITEACSLTQTIVLKFSIIVEKIVLVDDDVELDAPTSSPRRDGRRSEVRYGAAMTTMLAPKCASPDEVALEEDPGEAT